MPRSPICDLALPRFELLKRQPRPPHVSYTIAKREIPNEYGTPITFQVRKSRNGKSWWIDAQLDGMRMSNTLHTTKPDKAQRWIDAVEAGRVCVEP